MKGVKRNGDGSSKHHHEENLQLNDRDENGRREKGARTEQGGRGNESGDGKEEDQAARPHSSGMLMRKRLADIAALSELNGCVTSAMDDVIVTRSANARTRKRTRKSAAT